MFRFDDDDVDFKIDLSPLVDTADNSINRENAASPKEQSPKRSPGPASQVAKKQKMYNKDTKKILKKPSTLAVCYLCGQKFHSNVAMEQHQKTHIQGSSNSPVFPCNICGKNVKNLKIHWRQHKQENKNKNTNKTKMRTKKYTATTNSSAANSKSTTNTFGAIEVFDSLTKSIALSSDTKVEEASSSTDAIVTSVLSNKESDNGITSQHNEALSEIRDEQSPCSLINEPMVVLLSSNETFSSKLPPIVVEDYPIEIIQMKYNEFEPSQSTQQTLVAEGMLHQHADDMLHTDMTENYNVEFNPEEKFGMEIEKKTSNDRKVQCEICGKLVGLSYKRIHVKKYHTNIPQEVHL